ncbi:MAG: cell division protein FtsQ/DivIB [Minisyncoccia bacterium]
MLSQKHAISDPSVVGALELGLALPSFCALREKEGDPARSACATVFVNNISSPQYKYKILNTEYKITPLLLNEQKKRRAIIKCMRKTRRVKSQRLTRRYWHKIKVLFIIIFCLVLLFALYWWVFLSSFFQIRSISITGVDNSQVMQNSLNIFFQENNQKWVPTFIYQIYPQAKNNERNFLLFTSSQLSRFLLDKYPSISEVESHLDIRKGNLTLQITPREVAFLLCSEVKCYYLDKNGIVFGQAPESSGSLIQTIIIHQNIPFDLKTEVFSQKDLTFLASLFDLTNQTTSPLKIKDIELDQLQTSSINILTSEGWYLKINFNSNMPEILEIIQKLKEGELKNKTQLLNYIDCRYLPKVYYKFK